nr:MAG TPA: hypothetical protein [Caudoviricetes sp.]
MSGEVDTEPEWSYCVGCPNIAWGGRLMKVRRALCRHCER